MAVPGALAGPKRTVRSLKGEATGFANYGYADPDGNPAGDDGLADVLDGNISLGVPEYHMVTTVTTASP
ncbi:MAG: hypothetical protein WBO21_03905, partial [Acidimicrobiia bacterium]